MFLTTGADNGAARGLYDSVGGALAAQGPTVNYWFSLLMPDAVTTDPGDRKSLIASTRLCSGLYRRPKAAAGLSIRGA